MASIIKDGYQIPWASVPQPYEAANNKSCRDNLSICRDIVSEMESLGVIEFTSTKPYCVNPLGLVSRVVDGKTKHRLVFDGSRWVNLHVNVSCTPNWLLPDKIWQGFSIASSSQARPRGKSPRGFAASWLYGNFRP